MKVIRAFSTLLVVAGTGALVAWLLGFNPWAGSTGALFGWSINDEIEKA